MMEHMLLTIGQMLLMLPKNMQRAKVLMSHILMVKPSIQSEEVENIQAIPNICLSPILDKVHLY